VVVDLDSLEDRGRSAAFLGKRAWSRANMSRLRQSTMRGGVVLSALDEWLLHPEVYSESQGGSKETLRILKLVETLFEMYMTLIAIKSE